MARQSVTIFDVAQASGVSYSTVSRVLNGFEFVSADTRAKVLQAAKRLGYVANVQARSLAGGKSNIIGVVVPSIANSYCTLITQGIDLELAQKGYDMMLYTTHRKENKEASYVQAIANGVSEGLLLMVPLIEQQSGTNYLEILRQRNFPYVLIDQSDPSRKSSLVDSQNRQGAFEATQYLISLGHQRIGFVTGLMKINAAQERLEGYRQALAKHHIGYRQDYVVEADFNPQAGYQAGLHLLAREPRPSAIFASNDLSAFGVMDAIRSQGLGIPRDISVIGFDDIPQASVTYPKLSTVKQPLQEMGSAAARLLLEQIEKPAEQPQHICLEAHLIIRDSCARPANTLQD